MSKQMDPPERRKDPPHRGGRSSPRRRARNDWDDDDHQPMPRSTSSRGGQQFGSEDGSSRGSGSRSSRQHQQQHPSSRRQQYSSADPYFDDVDSQASSRSRQSRGGVGVGGGGGGYSSHSSRSFHEAQHPHYHDDQQPSPHSSIGTNESSFHRHQQQRSSASHRRGAPAYAIPPTDQEGRHFEVYTVPHGDSNDRKNESRRRPSSRKQSYHEEEDGSSVSSVPLSRSSRNVRASHRQRVHNDGDDGSSISSLPMSRSSRGLVPSHKHRQQQGQEIDDGSSISSLPMSRSSRYDAGERSDRKSSSYHQPSIRDGEDESSVSSVRSSRNNRGGMPGGSSQGKRGGATGRSLEKMHIDEHSNASNFDEDRYVRGRNETVSDWNGKQDSIGKGGSSTSLRQSFPSNNSMHRRGKINSDYFRDDNGDDGGGFDEENDYYVGGRGGGSVSSHYSSHSQRRQQRRRRNRGDQTSDDMSYDDVSKDGSRRGGGESVWSISKSVFSTLPDRIGRKDRHHRRSDGESIQEDDDEISLFSAGSSYSHRQNKAVSRSSSVGSRISQMSGQSRVSQISAQSSQQSPSSFYSPKKHRDGAKSGNYEYDSDDSIGSLLLGGFVRGRQEGSVPSSIDGSSNNAPSQSDASSGFLFDSKKRATDEAPIELISPPLTKERWAAADFGDTLSHLENLGFGIDLTGEDGEDGSEGDDEASVVERDDSVTKDLVSGDEKDEDSAWWIKDLEEEGWFQHDTTAVYSDRIPPPKRRLGASEEADANLNEDELADTIHQEPPGIVGDNRADALADIDSDTSTVGIENEDVEDWEERLWSLARAHYLEYSGASVDPDGESVSHHGSVSQYGSISQYGSLSQYSGFVEKSKNKVEEPTDEQSVVEQEQLYHDEYATEQKGVLLFRSLLLKCIEVYVDAFHRKVGGKENTSSKGVVDQTGFDPHKELKVYQYIPMPTARALFLEVIKMSDSSKNSFAGLDTTGEAVRLSAEKRADIIAKILVEDVLNIFRRYQVVTVKTSSKIGGDTKKSRKRLSKGTAKSARDAQTEMENYLYGEMFDEEEKDEPQERENAPDIVETKEHEIRIRSHVVKAVLNRTKTSEDEEIINPCWSSAAICQVLLLSVQTITIERTNEEEKQDDQQSASLYSSSVYSQNVATRSEQPMAQLYSLRYSPLFLLKALVALRLGSNAAGHLPSPVADDSSLISRKGQYQVTFKGLTDLLFDESYLIKRFELQGPYDATTTHLSNWEKAFSFQSEFEKGDGDGDEEGIIVWNERNYEKLVSLMVSTLHSHLKTTLVDTGYQSIKEKKVEGDGEDAAVTPHNETETDGDNITIQNYANIVATCLEIGRALHHLGVCLGRRQRDIQTGELKKDLMSDCKDTADAVSLEVKSYTNALDAFKGAIYVLSRAENDAVSSAMENSKKDLGNGKRRQKLHNGELRQDREASNTHRDTSEVRDSPNEDLQEIREAKVSVELHLADTLNCLGYCHDSKLSEYDKSLMAYRESLSLYIRHVGRFHAMVSNALHNMGAIHVELGQWREAASCFRQCLAILKRKAEKERTSQKTTNSSQDSQQSQMSITLQCLGNSLAELGEYDASIACFQEIINTSGSRKGGESEPTAPDTFVGEVLSQMARVHLKRASKLSRAFNWQCHLLLFSESENKKDEDPGSILARQLRMERNGKDCILKSIHSRRNSCYAAVMKETKPDFSSVDGDGLSQFSANEEDLKFTVSTEVPPFQLAALAKDLLVAGRLELRSRSYKAALSYCWESLLLSSLLISRNSGENVTAGGICDLLVFDKGLLKSGGASLHVTDKIIDSIDMVNIASTHDSAGIEFVQLLFLIGVSYTRTQDFDKAKLVMGKAQALLDPAKLPVVTSYETKGTIEEAVIQLDLANLYLRVGFVDSIERNFESAVSNYKEAIRIFNSTATHPILSSESKVNSNSEGGKLEDGDNGIPLSHDYQRKELEMVIRNGLACALHRLGQAYTEQGRPEKAVKCLEDTAHILNEIHEVREQFLDLKTAPSLPITSRCFWEEISAISTSMILSDANQRSGRIGMGGDSDRFSLECFERAVGMREFITTTVGSLSTVDTESSLECFEESQWDKRNMDCYSAMLVLIEKRGPKKKKELFDGEEKSWKSYPKFGADTDLASEEDLEDAETMLNDESLLTKEDILFRIGNLQVKSGQFRDAIDSYKEAEELTVSKLGTKDHAIVMNILYNMGNAYRAISLSSLSRESKSAKEDAIVCYSESIRISQAFFGKQHATSAESLGNLAALYMKAGNAWLDVLNEEKSDDDDDELAYKTFKESLSIRRRETGTQNELEMASILHHLGNLCLRKIGYYYRCDDPEALKFADDAMNFLSESLKIRKLSLGPDHVTVGDTYQSIGIAHLNRALALKSDTVKKESELSNAYQALTSAVETRRSFTSIFIKPMGSRPSSELKDSILMEAHCVFYLGRVEETRSNYDQAKSHYVNALRLFQAEGKQRLSKMSVDSFELADSEGKLLLELEAINLWAARALYHIANIHKATSCIGDAVGCYEEAIRIRSQYKSAKRLNSALIHLDFAKALHDHQNYDKSIECYSYSLRIFLTHFGKDSLDVADTLTGMGKSFAMKSVFEKTMQCYDKAMRVYEYREGLAPKEKKGLLHREIADALQRLDGDIFEVLEHYRSSVSFLEEFNERHSAAVPVSEKSDEELNKRLLRYYSEMLAILRRVLDIERDRKIKAELRDEIGDVLHRMGNLYATFGQYNEAMDCFSEVLQNQRKTNDDELRIADLLFNMGNIYLEQNLPEKSLDCLRESYDITNEALGEDNKELHSTMYLMGVAMSNLADYESALKWLTQALKVLGESNDDENVTDQAARGKTLHQTGTVYEKTGDQARAITCFQESAQILKVVQGNDLELSNSLNSMGNLLRNVSDFEQALDCYGQSLTIRSGLGDELLVANTKNNIGAVLSATDDLDRAMAFSAEALRIKTGRLGSDNVEIARALVNMGQLYLDQKLYISAEKYFQRGLEIFQGRMESDHPDTAMCMHKLGVIREALLDDEGALDYYLQSSNSASENNVTMAFSLHNAALIYTRQENTKTALECMNKALDTKMATLGADHSETATSHHWLGTIFFELQDSEAALSHYKDALKIRVECFGTEHLDVAGTLFGLGQVHFLRDEFEESIECLLENLRVLRKFECEDETVSKSELLLGSSFQELGQFDTANEHLLEALHLMVSAHGANHPDVAQSLFRLGICFCETNQYSESLEKFQECLEIRISLLGPLHIECANTYESIGIVQQKTERHEDAIHSFERALAIKKTSAADDDEDFCILLQFIGSSLFALKRYDDAVGYFADSAERKKNHYGRTDEDYAMSVIDLAAAYVKMGDEKHSMEYYLEAVECGGLPSDSWELGVAHKCLGGYFFHRKMFDVSLERYGEATAIFEWNIDNVQGSEAKHEDLLQCYVHLLDLEDENAGLISDARAELCYKLANCYVQVNKHEDAVLMYREAIMIQTQLHGTDHLSVANTLHNLGNCYRDLSEFEKSAECLSKSLSLSTINFEDENEEVADTLHCLAMTLMSTCELDDSASLFERALAIRKKRLGALDLNIASTLYNLAHILQLRGNWNNSMKHSKEALRIQRMTVGDDSPITTSTLECIGRIHMDKRDFENAIQCFNTCVSQGKPKLQRECGIIHKYRGESFKARKMLTQAGLHALHQLSLSESQTDELDLLNLTTKFQEKKGQISDKDLLGYAENIMFYGSVLMNLEKFNEALECFRFSNVIFQAKYGSDHLTISENLHSTGFILEKISDSPNSQHQLEEALEQLTEALRIRKLHLVGSHPDLEETLLCLGKVHHKLGNVSAALNFLPEAIRARDVRLGRKHARMDDADALLQVGQLHQQSGQFRQALHSFEECLDIRRQILGGNHPSIGELLFYIGNLLREVGDLDLAQTKFEESLAIAEQADPDSLETADTLFSLGVLHTEQKQFSLALDAYLGSLHIHKARGSTKTAIAEILNNIGITYFGMKEFDRAQIYHAEALESLIQELGDDHVDVAFCWHSLGVVHQELGDQAEAFKSFQNAVGIERTELYLQSLGMCLVKMNDNENAYVCLDEALRMKTLDCGNDADDDLAEIQRHLGIVWMRKKRFDESLKCFEAALKIKLQIPDCSESEKDHKNLINCLDGALEAVSEVFGTQHLKYARLLHQKGNFHGTKKEHTLAIEAYVETLRIYKGEHGDSHLSVANTLFNLGVSLNAKGSPEKAIRCFAKALRITKARLGDDHLDVADTYEQVAESNKLLLRYNDATSYYEKALNVRKQATGASDLKSAAIMHELGKIHSHEGLWENAERAFKESVRIRTVHLGQDDHLVAESMYNLGLVYKSRSDSAKALKYLEGSLRTIKSKLPSADTQLADNFHSLGGVHSSLGNIDKSVFCYDKAVQIYTEIYGKQNGNVASSLAGKGETLRSDEQYQEALSCFSECLDIRKTVDGPTPAEESGNVMSQMGEIYSQLGDSTNASLSFASALTAYRLIFGTKHQTVADVLQKMSAHFVKVGEFERGYSCVKETLSLQQELLGEDDTRTADSHYCMGTILYEWNNYAEASKCFEKARDIHKEKHGETHLSVANSNFFLGCISERKGDYDSAVQCLQDSLSGRRAHLDEMDHAIADNLARLGHVYYKQSEWDSAVTAFSDCLKIQEATRGTDTGSQVNVADALFDLGTALVKALDTQRSMQLFTDALKEYQRHLDNPKDVKIAKCHSSIGEIYEKTNELSKAVNALEMASAIYENHVGTDPPEKEIRASKKIDAYSGQAETLFRLATAKDRLGEEVIALKQYRKAMRLYKSLFGRDNLHVAKILNRLANMKGRAGSVDKAMVLFDESLRIRMLHLGNNHEDVAETLFGMGIVFEKRRDYGAAMKAYSDCLRIRSSKFGSDSMEVAQVVVNIGVVRGNKGDFSGALKSWNKALSIYRKHGLGDDDALVATVLGHQRLANQLKKRGRNKN